MEGFDPVPILAVDDQEENLLALEAILTDPALRLVKARSGHEALKYLLDKEFAVILMDASMPIMDGFETARIIHSRPKTRSTPIVFLTATHRDSLNALIGYSTGAVDYIFKPLVPEILRAKVYVFVELFRKANEIRLQGEELATYRVELEQRLGQLAALNEELHQLSRDTAEARDQAQAALEFKSLVVESVPNGIILVDQAGKIVMSNVQTEKMFGYSGEEMLGKQIEMLVPDRLRDQHPEHRENFITNPGSRKMGGGRDLYGVRKDGTEIPIEVSLTPLKTETEQHVLASIIDITDRKRYVDGLRIARDQAQAASQFKSEFVASMSHEIRTPMNAIIGMCNLLMKTSLSDTQLQFGRSIKKASHALLNIINDILDLSKIEAGKLELEIVDFDLVQLVETTCGLLSNQAREKEVSLVSFVEPKMPALLRGDPDRLRQVLLNLLNNAVKFSEKDEVVVRATIAAEETNSLQVLFTIDDRGIGLNEEELGRLFQPFMQADAGITRKYGGTGLGLSICKSLVALMGGTIGVRSEKGKGSTFWCQVPLEIRSAVPVMTIKEELKNVRVLIVDDQQSARETLHDYVVSWGMLNGVAKSSQEALTLMQQAHIDGDPFKVVIIDLVMPEMNGAELAKEIQNDPAISTAKLMLLTAFDASGLGQQAIEMGFRAYLTKPVRQSQLLDCITNVLYGTAPLISPFALDHAEAGGGPQLQKELVLIAEDHPINQQVAMLFVSELGFMSHVVTTGQEVLDALSRNQYSLILMDCQMPVLDGFDTTNAIRKSEALTGHHIPIIAMTANAMKGDREKCIAAGMDDYISKPFDPAELRLTIEKWMPLSKTAEAPKASSEKLESSPIDIEKLKSRYGHHNVGQFTNLFIIDAPIQLDILKQALNSRNISQLLDCVHGLKGICSTICAGPMEQLCVNIESVGNEIGNEAGNAVSNETSHAVGNEAGNAVSNETGNAVDNEAGEEKIWQTLTTLIDRLSQESCRVELGLRALKNP